ADAAEGFDPTVRQAARRIDENVLDRRHAETSTHGAEPGEPLVEVRRGTSGQGGAHARGTIECRSRAFGCALEVRLDAVHPCALLPIGTELAAAREIIRGDPAIH